jgi:hypothetical protein
MADTTIKVTTETRDRLADLAGEQGTSIGQLVARLAEQQPTAAQIRQRVAEGRRLMRDHFAMRLTDDELDQGPDLLQRVYEVAAEDSRSRLAPGRSA